MAANGTDKSAGEIAPTVIKKYANRRLYHTGTSTYVTLEDLAAMVQAGEDFVVYDAKSSEEITRSVLAQIIFEQENKAGNQNLLPVAFLRQLIRFYGDSMRALVPSFLEFSMENLAREDGDLRAKMSPHITSGFGPQTFTPSAFQHAVQDQVRANVALFGEAMRMFSPFPPPTETKPEERAPDRDGDLDALKRQMGEMQARLEELAKRSG